MEEGYSVIRKLNLSEEQVHQIVLEWYTNGMCPDIWQNEDGDDLEEYKLTDEYKNKVIEYEKEFLDYAVFGRTPPTLNKDFLDELNTFTKIEELSASEIIERWSEYLSEEQIEQLKNDKRTI